MRLSSFGKPTSRHFARASRLLVALGALTGSVSAMAAAGGSFGTLKYGPLAGPGTASPTSIPTIGGIGLVLLSAFLLLAFWRMHRSGAIQGGRFMAFALVSGALASGLGGINLVSEAMAQVSSPTGVFKEMNSASGGVLTLSEGEADIACVHNVTSVPLKIVSMDEMYGQGISVTPGPECAADDNSGSGCSVDQVLDPDDVCGVTLQPYLPPS